MHRLPKQYIAKASHVARVEDMATELIQHAGSSSALIEMLMNPGSQQLEYETLCNDYMLRICAAGNSAFLNCQRVGE
ncbi:hypothetical protein M514_02834 [Trichuris suis]|uniref:Uncharacterized protein n=1 Tax=Trichuris suis TaxID=68888 RepID=A0A085NEP8_9BILA|nr:hypothetical protein M513_02834 [Trichuris suis]KFD67944.1 hypothetical protein M514_02834 [Trichuris suis]